MKYRLSVAIDTIFTIDSRLIDLSSFYRKYRRLYRSTLVDLSKICLWDLNLVQNLGMGSSYLLEGIKIIYI